MSSNIKYRMKVTFFLLNKQIHKYFGERIVHKNSLVVFACTACGMCSSLIKKLCKCGLKLNWWI